MTVAPWRRNETVIPPSLPPRQSEASLQRSCVSLLDRYEAMGKLRFTSIPNGAVLRGDREERARHMHSLKQQGLRPGAPDVVIAFTNGRMGWCELKAAGGRLSDEQVQWRDALRALGHEWRLIKSVDDLKEFLVEMGC